MSLNVLLPEMVNAPAPPWLSVMLVYATPPPAKVLPLPLVIVIVPVPVTVRLVEVDASQAVPDPASVQVPDPTAIVRVLELLEENVAAAPLRVTLYVAASNVPLVIVNAPVIDLSVMHAS